MLSQLEQGLFLFAMFVLMVGMGSTLDLKDFLRVLKEPRPALTGCLVQFVCMPLLSYSIARILNLTPTETLALLLVGCTPGGSSSNMYTWFARGIVPLSITMTFLSTLAAIVLMPLLVKVLASQSSLTLTIPLTEISGSLLFVFIPVGLGVFLRQRAFAFLPALQKLGALMGIFASALMLILWIPKMWQQWIESHSNAYLAIGMLGSLGFVLGYALSRFFGFSEAIARTISIETGLQNTLLTFTVMTLSFSPEFVESVGWIPLAYGAFILGIGAVVVFLFRAYDGVLGRFRMNRVRDKLDRPHSRNLSRKPM